MELDLGELLTIHPFLPSHPHTGVHILQGYMEVFLLN